MPPKVAVLVLVAADDAHVVGSIAPARRSGRVVRRPELAEGGECRSEERGGA
jgi:hypothetical protein